MGRWLSEWESQGRVSDWRYKFGICQHTVVNRWDHRGVSVDKGLRTELGELQFKDWGCERSRKQDWRNGYWGGEKTGNDHVLEA